MLLIFLIGFFYRSLRMSYPNAEFASCLLWVSQCTMSSELMKSLLTWSVLIKSAMCNLIKSLIWIRIKSFLRHYKLESFMHFHDSVYIVVAKLNLNFQSLSTSFAEGLFGCKDISDECTTKITKLWNCLKLYHYYNTCKCLYYM